MNLKLSDYLTYGFVIFPIITVYGLLMNYFSDGKINYLFWAVIPSFIYEKILEPLSFILSKNLYLNSLFVILFWFITGLVIALVGHTFKILYSFIRNNSV